jgi:hypothetical protein
VGKISAQSSADRLLRSICRTSSDLLIFLRNLFLQQTDDEF